MADFDDDMHGERPPIGVLAKQFAEDAGAYAQAEITLLKTRATTALGAVRRAAVLTIIALFLVQAAIVGLLVGIVLLLAPIIGTGWATLAVFAAALLIAALCVWIGIAGFRRATTVAKDVKDTDHG